MSGNRLDYESPTPQSTLPSHRMARATWIVVYAVLLTNFGLLALSTQFALRDAIFWTIGACVMANWILLVAAIVAIPLLHPKSAGESKATYLGVSIGLPMAAIPVDFVLLFILNLK